MVQVRYEDAAPARTRDLQMATLCGWDVEWDVEPCASGTPDAECTRTFEFVLPVALLANAGETISGDCASLPEAQPQPEPQQQQAAGRTRANATAMEVAYIKPHFHEGVLGFEIQDATTNTTLCAMSRADGGITFGSRRAAGDEEGFPVGVRSCSYGVEDAPRLALYAPVRVRVVYDARRYLAGVMGGAQLLVHLPVDPV